MGYKNPFTILGISVDKWAGASAEDLRRKKKELLAELELSSDQYLHQHGVALSKQDLNDLFEDLEAEDQRNFHVMISRLPSLHDFLISSRLDYFYEGDASLLPTYSEEFLKWLAPWFVEAYNVRLANAYRQKDLDELRALTIHELPFSPELLTIAYRDTYQIIDEHLIHLTATNEKIAGGLQPDGQLYELAEEWLISALNLLPDYFAQIRDAIGEALEQLALSVYRRHQRGKLSLLILRQALKLNVSSGVRKHLTDLQESLFRIHPEEEWKSWLDQQKNEGVSPWLVAAGVGAIGLAVWLLSKWRG